jgi:hypothetical protein
VRVFVWGEEGRRKKEEGGGRKEYPLFPITLGQFKTIPRVRKPVPYSLTQNSKLSQVC